MCTLLGTFVGLTSFNRGRDKDVQNEAREKEQVNVKLNHIISGVDDVRTDIKVNERQMRELSDQIIRLDESTKTAHKRIDKLEKNS